MRMISQTTASFSPLAWLNGLREHSSSPPQPCSMKRFFHLYPVLVLIPYSWHRALKFLLPNNFNANSIFWFIGSTFFHGIRQTIEICRRSVTYVLNHLCYLCIEPGPSSSGRHSSFCIVRSELKRWASGVIEPRHSMPKIEALARDH